MRREDSVGKVLGSGTGERVGRRDQRVGNRVGLSLEDIRLCSSREYESVSSIYLTKRQQQQQQKPISGKWRDE